MKNKARSLHLKRKFSYDAIDQNHKKYFDKKNYMYKKKYLETRNHCPCCFSKNFREIFKKRGSFYNICDNCSLIFLNPVFKDNELNKYYINLHQTQSVIVKNEAPFYRKIFTKGLLSIQQFKKKKNLIDIGCSSGFFLDIASNYGWNTFGIEYNKEKLLVDKKHKLFSQDIETLPKEIKFDVVTMWDVFEHIKDGNDCLKKIKKKLNKKGLVFIQTPNVFSIAARILQEKCNVFDGIEHVNLYNFDNINFIAKQNGFKVLKSEAVIPEVAVSSNYLDYSDPYFGSSNFSNTILNLASEKKILDKKLGYKMQTILQLI